MRLQDSYFLGCSNATKSGLVDSIIDNKPKHLLLNEMDKLSKKGKQIFLLNLIEIGIAKTYCRLIDKHKKEQKS
jgi:hypothetical protein